MNRILVLGASPNPQRYSNKMVRNLIRKKKDVTAVGFREGTISGLPILKGFPQLDNVHTISLYIGRARISEYTEYILSLHPRRIIMNPGTENEELIDLFRKEGIEVLTDCSITLLKRGRL
jgi:predicted CoA-binding protein